MMTCSGVCLRPMSGERFVTLSGVCEVVDCLRLSAFAFHWWTCLLCEVTLRSTLQLTFRL